MDGEIQGKNTVAKGSKDGGQNPNSLQNTQESCGMEAFLSQEVWHRGSEASWNR